MRRNTTMSTRLIRRSMVIKLRLRKVERRRPIVIAEIGTYGEGLLVEDQGPRGESEET
jgi:hypothetical protein